MPGASVDRSEHGAYSSAGEHPSKRMRPDEEDRFSKSKGTSIRRSNAVTTKADFVLIRRIGRTTAIQLEAAIDTSSFTSSDPLSTSIDYSRRSLCAASSFFSPAANWERQSLSLPLCLRLGFVVDSAASRRCLRRKRCWNWIVDAESTTEARQQGARKADGV